jgi:hypothetical protein
VNYFSSLAIFMIALAHLCLFGLSSAEKIMSGLPPWFLSQVNRTFLVHLPGGAFAQFYLIVALELLVAVGCLISLIRVEFLPYKMRPALQISLLLAMFTNIILGSGQRIFAQWGGDNNGFQGASNSFSYFGISLLCLLLIQNSSEKK